MCVHVRKGSKCVNVERSDTETKRLPALPASMARLAGIHFPPGDCMCLYVCVCMCVFVCVCLYVCVCLEELQDVSRISASLQQPRPRRLWSPAAASVILRDADAEMSFNQHEENIQCMTGRCVCSGADIKYYYNYLYSTFQTKLQSAPHIK